ncbi:MAG: hypothetical protein IT454_13620 [Planctomycetes bacterium]|nr:hypothetical protein [Planctomycetota bacterium]
MNEDRAASRRFLATLFAAAFLVRILALVALGAWRVPVGSSAWDWGHEPACIASALLDGRGYSDPWGHGSGATSWLTPPFPVLLAGLLKLCGGVGSSCDLALDVLQSLVSAANCVALVALGHALGSARAGRLAGWLFALYPIAISNCVQLVWDTTLVAAALTGVLLLLARLRDDARGSLRAGLAFGALLLLNPAPLGLIPIVAWHVARRARAKGLALFFGCAFAVCAPWLLRNQLVLGAFSLRPNFGVELRIGNHADATGRPQPFLYHPSHVARELELYRELGEVAYARENTERAMHWIRSDPRAFVALCAKRVMLFWLGETPTSDARRAPGVAPASDPASWIKFVAYAAVGLAGLAGLAASGWTRDARLIAGGVLLLFGAPYYLSHVSERYRFPIDPLLVLLAAQLALRLGQRWRARSRP